jgi:acetyl esterase/lipase
MPVTFMLCADKDREPSSALAGLHPMLKAAGIETEVHIYASGEHGFGINPHTRNPSPVATTWQIAAGRLAQRPCMLKVN